MAGHPARQLAQMAADAAEELRGYTAPPPPTPGNSARTTTAPSCRSCTTRSRIWPLIDGIAQATADEHAKQQLAEGIGRLLSGCAHLSAAAATLSPPRTAPDTEPLITAQAARLSAADFPATMTPDMLQAATTPAARKPGPAAAISPALARAGRPPPGSSPTR